MFGVKQLGPNIQELSQKDLNYWKSYFDIEASESDALSDFYEELHMYKSSYSNYAGNVYTYYIFKQLIKLLLTEVYLYKYQGQVLTHLELINKYRFSLHKHPEPNKIK